MERRWSPPGAARDVVPVRVEQGPPARQARAAVSREGQVIDRAAGRSRTFPVQVYPGAHASRVGLPGVVPSPVAPHTPLENTFSTTTSVVLMVSVPVNWNRF